MSSEVRNKSKGKSERFNDVRFVQYELSAEEKKQCKSWCTSFEEIDTLLLRLMEGGYRASEKWDDYGKCFAAFIQTFDTKHPHFGCILTGRGSTPLKALKQALFKHYVVFDEEWGSWLEARGGVEIDD